MPLKKKRKQKRSVGAGLYWILTALAAGAFIVSFAGMPMFPWKYSVIVAAILLIILLLTFLLSNTFPRSRIIKFLDTVLCVFLLVSSVLMPKYQARITDLFNSVTGTISNINLYVMNENYRSTHPELFASQEVSGQLSDYLNGTFITSVTADGVNSAYAVGKLQEDYGVSVNTTDRPSYYDAVEALYENEGNVLIMPESYVAMILENEEFESFLNDVKVIGTIKKKITSVLPTGSSALTKEPFIVFFGGNDEEGELYLEGKTDVDMLVAVNPKSHQIAIISLPRDSYIDNPALGWGDKLTHLGMYGIQNTLKGIGDYLDETINNYVVINFTTFRNIINAIGGVDIYNEYEFVALDGQYFPEGWIHLEGEYALMFVRERYSLYDGDFGRNYHQQQVMYAMIEKITSPEIIVHMDSLLDALEGTFLTNLSSDAIYGLCRKQLQENISWNIVNYHITGDVGYAECASAPGMELSVVFPYDNQVAFISQIIDDVMAGETLQQEELPYGEYYDYGYDY